nr:10 kDa chaperonin [Paraburkholderia busanensis]
MNIRPLNDRIAVREIKPPTVSPGGIFIGEYVDEGLSKEIVVGEVVAVGPGLKNSKGGRESMWGITAGQIVQFSPVCSHKETVDGEEITIIRRDSVIGVQT